MDGTLVDTEPYWIAAEFALVGEYDGDWTQEDVLAVVGSGLWTTAERLRSHGVPLTADEIVSDLTARVMRRLAVDGAPWRPGAVRMLREIREAGIRTALVTMSIAPMARAVVEQLGFDGFDTLVTGDAVPEAKPHPAPYLTALDRLGVAAADAVAIEDSVPGVAAAVASGAVTIAVPHVAQVPEAPDHETWDGLQGRTLADLTRVFAARRAHPASVAGPGTGTSAGGSAS